MLGPVAGNAIHHALRAHGNAQIADQVALRTYPRGVPPGERRIVEREPVVVFGGWDNELGPRLAKELGPGIRIELRGREPRNEILVAERGLVTVRLAMMLELR